MRWVSVELGLYHLEIGQRRVTTETEKSVYANCFAKIQIITRLCGLTWFPGHQASPANFAMVCLRARLLYRDKYHSAPFPAERIGSQTCVLPSLFVLTSVLTSAKYGATASWHRRALQRQHSECFGISVSFCSHTFSTSQMPTFTSHCRLSLQYVSADPASYRSPFGFT